MSLLRPFAHDRTRLHGDMAQPAESMVVGQGCEFRPNPTAMPIAMAIRLASGADPIRDRMDRPRIVGTG